MNELVFQGCPIVQSLVCSSYSPSIHQLLALIRHGNYGVPFSMVLTMRGSLESRNAYVFHSGGSIPDQV